MTALRSLARKVATFTVRWAAAGCKDWAEGLEREVEFIESDWRALAWAVGSMRVLLDRSAMRPTSDQDIRPRSPRMIDIAGWMWYFIWGLESVTDIFQARSWWDRTSGYLFGFAVAYFAVTSIADWRRERWEPPISDIEANWLFGRKELELKLARSGTASRWFPMLAIVSGITGWVMHIEGGMHLHHTSSVVWIAVGVIAIWDRLFETPAKIKRQIERRDAWIAEERARRNQPEKRAYSDHWGRSQAPKPEPQPATIQS